MAAESSRSLLFWGVSTSLNEQKQIVKRPKQLTQRPKTFLLFEKKPSNEKNLSSSAHFKFFNSSK